MARLIDELRVILENTYNAYMFEVRCRQHKIIVEKLSDGTILAYRADDRDDRVQIDTSQQPFDKIMRFGR